MKPHFQKGLKEGPTAWPARLPDLNPIDLYLCGELQNIVYKIPADNDATLLERINNDIFERIGQNVRSRIEACIVGDHSHIFINSIQLIMFISCCFNIL